jgi:L-lactate dehydrogenase complex protein LldG
MENGARSTAAQRRRDMTGTRETVLNRIRTALDTPGVAAPPAEAIPRDYLREGAYGAGSEPVVELLIDRLVDYKAHVHRVTADGIGQALEQALDGTGSVVIAPGLDPAISGALGGHRVITTDSAQEALTPQQLDAIDAVVTTARVAIALSGTIVLDGGPGQGRRAITLVPDRHVIVLRAEQVVQTVPEAIAELDALAPLTMIAGPSATSDIELERVEGVHGPRSLHVVIVG